jgi:hypothetical protein
MIFQSVQALLYFVASIEPNERGCRIWPGLKEGQRPWATVQGIGGVNVTWVVLDPVGCGKGQCHMVPPNRRTSLSPIAVQ